MSDLFDTTNTADNGIVSEEVKADIVKSDQAKETGVAFVYENKNDALISPELADLLKKGVSRTISFARDITNLDEAVKSSVALVLPEVEDGIIKDNSVTEKNLEEVKKVYTKLNKLWTDLEDDRKGMHNVTEAPYKSLNDSYKERTKLLTDAIKALKSQISTVETEMADFKKKNLTQSIIEMSKDYRPDFPEILAQNNNALFNKRIWDNRFTNKTMTSTAVQKQVMETLASINEELKTIEAMEDNSAALAQYYQTGSLTDALTMQRKVREAKELATRLSASRAAQSTPAQPVQQSQPAPVQTAPEPQAQTVAPVPPQTQVQPAPQKIQLTQVAQTSIEKFFHIWHDGPNAEEAFRALTQFLRDNGFHRENMKQVYIDYLNM